VAWLGYSAPPNPLAGANRGFAVAGGARLDAALDGLAASRRAGSHPEVRTTVLAHSYGTEVVEEAAGEDGDLAADAVVLLGSPGMAGSADDLEAPAVYQALASSDLVRRLAPLGGLLEPVESVFGPLGQLTDADGYGATTLPTDDEQGHTDYYEPRHPTLAAVGGVVAGTSWR
jgi:pimeloyl-ACP methyl ester carboxylesterase